MTGTPGVGKTFLSACIARTVSAQGFSVVYDTAINVFAQFENAHFTREEESRVSKRRYLLSDLLILDDLGSEMTTPFVQSALYELVNTRLINHKATVISTNLSPEEMSLRYSMQSTSRLLGEYQMLKFQGPDIRQKKKLQ
jgi:DNA replication protein DnaC